MQMCVAKAIVRDVSSAEDWRQAMLLVTTVFVNEGYTSSVNGERLSARRASTGRETC